jgi:hypothetical protein
LIFGFILQLTPGVFASDEIQWRKKQQEVINIVRRMTQIGIPSFRCALYVPGFGAFFMKMTPQKMDDLGPPVPKTYVDDVAEVIDIATKVGETKLLEKDEKLFLQSRFQNSIYLRILDQKLVMDFEKTPKKNLLALRKLLEEVLMYIDGVNKDEKTDVWISASTESFSRGAISLARIPDEGMIIPGKAIVVYRKYPGLWNSGGEKALADKLFEVFSNSKVLNRHYLGYDLIVGMESGTQLLFASYPLKDIENLKREELKYFKFTDK